MVLPKVVEAIRIKKKANMMKRTRFLLKKETSLTNYI
jgi:hypothetical protein